MSILTAIGKFIGGWLLEKGGLAVITYLKQWIALQKYKKKVKGVIKEIIDEKDPVKRAARLKSLLSS